MSMKGIPKKFRAEPDDDGKWSAKRDVPRCIVLPEPGAGTEAALAKLDTLTWEELQKRISTQVPRWNRKDIERGDTIDITTD